MMLVRLVYSAFSLYLLLILLRWFAPYLELDVYGRKLRFIAQVTDPLLTRIRRVLPAMGPVDFAPLAALFLVWLMRELAIQLLLPAR